MGTDYYLRKKKPRIVRVYDKLHLGKSSCGWWFNFQEQENIHSFEDVKKLIDSGEYFIIDEYGKKHTPDEFYELVEHKKQNDKFEGYGAKNIDGYSFIDEDFF